MICLNIVFYITPLVKTSWRCDLGQFKRRCTTPCCTTNPAEGTGALCHSFCTNLSITLKGICKPFPSFQKHVHTSTHAYPLLLTSKLTAFALQPTPRHTVAYSVWLQKKCVDLVDVLISRSFSNIAERCHHLRWWLGCWLSQEACWCTAQHPWLPRPIVVLSKDWKMLYVNLNYSAEYATYVLA